MSDTPAPAREIAVLIDLMARLRTPGTGCAWDLQQTFQSIAPYTIEEAHEVADAIARRDMADLVDELGDLLLQVVFHARMAEEIGAFAFGDVVEAITAKLIRRHPHVFGAARGLPADEVKALWARIKAEEKAARRLSRGSDEDDDSALAGVPAGLAPLLRALKLQDKAGRVGFDWNDPRAVIAKIREEIAEIEAELDADDAPAAARELGDLLFAAVNLARHLKADPDMELRLASAKFERRFRSMERMAAAQGTALPDLSLAAMEALWVKAKASEGG
jgi:ATP diphosphatase